MTIGSFPIAATPVAAASSSSASGVGIMAPFVGFGTQGVTEFRGVHYWANEDQTRFRARDTDGDELLGVTDKDPIEKVWYEIDLIDILHGASIQTMVPITDGGVTIFAQELISNGQTTHMARVLIGGGLAGAADSTVRFKFTCSDGALRVRSLKIRSKFL